MTGQKQRLAALDRANRRRLAHSQAKRDIRDGRPVRLALAEPDADTIRLEPLLLAFPGTGQQTIGLALRRSDIAEARLTRRWCDLTERERRVLLKVMDHWQAGHSQSAPWECAA